jgi:hypothetical protein
MRFPYFYIYFWFFKSCLMILKLRLKIQSKKAERVKAENQYFPYSARIKRAMVEAYCPTLVELVQEDADRCWLLDVFNLRHKRSGFCRPAKTSKHASNACGHFCGDCTHFVLRPCINIIIFSP